MSSHWWVSASRNLSKHAWEVGTWSPCCYSFSFAFTFIFLCTWLVWILDFSNISFALFVHFGKMDQWILPAFESSFWLSQSLSLMILIIIISIFFAYHNCQFLRKDNISFNFEMAFNNNKKTQHLKYFLFSEIISCLRNINIWPVICCGYFFQEIK